MSVVVELRAFYHHEEAFLVLVHQVDAFHGGPCEQVAALGRHGSVDFVRHGKHFSRLEVGQVFPGVGDVIAFVSPVP
jgi:hypothetical protein